MTIITIVNQATTLYAMLNSDESTIQQRQEIEYTYKMLRLIEVRAVHQLAI